MPAEPGEPDPTHRSLEAFRLGDPSGAVVCRLAEEVPVGLLYNGMPHAVVMATPCDLEDLAIGFSITDGIGGAGELGPVTISAAERGWEVDVRLSAAALARFLRDRQRRHGRSYTSCGLCGIETMEGVPAVAATVATAIEPLAIRRALGELRRHQPLNRLTGAAHAAAWVGGDGGIMTVREDVGRHNALDKLIGARSRQGGAAPEGFCLVTSRCSYEMVQKAAAAGMGLLVGISAPTALAVDAARQAGLGLVALARADSQIVYAGQERVRADYGAGTRAL